MRRLRKARNAAIIAATTGLLFVALAEAALRFLAPQIVLFPRWEFSSEYGLVLPKNAVMVHERAGRWRFHYTINEQRCRGGPIPDPGGRPALVVLGDSFGMGMGVDDGEEFPAIMSEQLRDRYQVINTSTPGWGLTQQIRRYYEFAARYGPSLVILQFCANDLEDIARHPVTRLDNGRFAFQNTPYRPHPIFNFFSTSRVMQHSQLYSFLRALYESRRDRRAHAASPSTGSAPTSDEARYIELLDAFASDLQLHGIRLILISVNRQLDAFPHLRRRVEDLHARGQLEYVEVAEWLDADKNYTSPEGHPWGREAHRIIGSRLADYTAR